MAKQLEDFDANLAGEKVKRKKVKVAGLNA